MKLELIKVDGNDVYSGFWVKVDGKEIGAVSASDAQALSDHINIQQMASEGYQAPYCTTEGAPSIYDKHEREW